MRKLIVLSWLLCILAGISYLLWTEDWKYTLPTPVPEKYKGDVPINAASLLSKLDAPIGKPVFLHFFNPGCPCSRFNIPHVQSLIKKYGDRLTFAIVVMHDNDELTIEQVKEKFDADLPVFFDKAIADSCRVYSTPQAVLIDANQELYYRGNYNRSRFCEDKNTNYAQIAIDSLLADNAHLITDKAALKSYGCSLPVCEMNNP